MRSMEPGWISAVAALIASGTAAFVAKRGTKELSRWRTQQRETKRSAVAGEVLVATLRFLTGLGSLVSPLVSRPLSDPDPRDEHKQMREVTAADWADFATFSNDFVKAWELAETYLPENVTALLDKIWKLRTEIRSAQMTFYATPLGKGTEFFKIGWGSAPQTKIDTLRTEARQLLRPIAQMMDGDEEDRANAASKQLEEEKRRQLEAGNARP